MTKQVDCAVCGWGSHEVCERCEAKIGLCVMDAKYQLTTLNYKVMAVSKSVRQLGAMFDAIARYG